MIRLMSLLCGCGYITILYYVNGTGQKIIVTGERRYQATKNAGLKKIPAISIDGNIADNVALIENILRQDLTALEEVQAFQRLKGKYKYTNESLVQVFTKAANTISETLLIL